MSRRLARLLAPALVAVLTSGCVAAVVPVAAAGLIGKRQVIDKPKKAKTKRAARRAVVPNVPAVPRDPTQMVPGQVYTGGLPAPAGASPAPAATIPTVATADAVPPGMQYLYGSGEASALSIQAWRGLIAYVAQKMTNRPGDSVVLDVGAALDAPRFVPCGDKPLAAVFDVDETVLLNLGAEYDAAVHPGPFDPKRWDAWERQGAAKVVAVPGARKALEVLRTMGVTVIFNTNRAAANATFTEAALTGAGLGPAKHGETLFLQGDDADGPRKDGRRATIAARYCVIAMGGDQLGDFSDLFNAGQPTAARRAAVSVPPISAKWGAGWFVLPNAAYGSGLKGSLDDVFPADKRWSPAP